MRLDERHWLAYDRENFERIRETQIHVLPLKKHPLNPLMIPDKPWEEDVHIYGSVIKIDGMYRMWYYARTQGYRVRSLCYAQSADGIHWEKPELDVATYEGKKTNIVFGTSVMGEAFEESDTVLYTPWDKGREYKLLYVARYPQHKQAINAVRLHYYQELANAYKAQSDWQMAAKLEERVQRELSQKIPASVYIATSGDGIHWREADMPAVPFLDDISHMMYDPYADCYRIYGRGFAYDAARCQTDRDHAFFDGYLGRSVFMSSSKDAITWDKERLVLTADGFDRPGDEIYSMAVFPWQGKYLGMVQMYHGAPKDMTLDVQLAISGDGEHFIRVGDRNPLIPLGAIGEWDRFNTCIADCPIFEEGKVKIYFNGAVFRHLRITGSCEYGGKDTWDRIVRIGLGECEEDRFACAQASFGGGELTSVPLTLAGRWLHLNCDSAWGALEVTVLGKERQDTRRISQNGCDIAIELPAWALEECVRLRFTLKNARLYAFWAQES